MVTYSSSLVVISLRAFIWGHRWSFKTFSDAIEAVTQISVALKKTKQSAMTVAILSNSLILSCTYTHGVRGTERADSVLLDHPDINGLSYSSPFCQPAEDGEPQKSFQRRAAKTMVPGRPRREREHQMRTYARICTPNPHKHSDSVLSHRFYFTNTNTQSRVAEEGLPLSSRQTARYTPLHPVGTNTHTEGDVRARRGNRYCVTATAAGSFPEKVLQPHKHLII